MKSLILSLLFLLTVSPSYVWPAGPTHETQADGRGVLLVQKQVEGFVQLDGRMVFSSENELLLVEIQDIIFIPVPRFPSWDSSLNPPELTQCFPEDRFEPGVFIREISCNNGFGTAWCLENTCVSSYTFTDDVGQPTGRTSLVIYDLDKENKKAKFVRFEKMNDEELFDIVGSFEETR